MPLFTHLWRLCVVCLLLIGSPVLAQTRLAGRVTDAATQEPLAGVNIAVKGTVTGTTTTANGTFSLSTATPTPLTLQVSYVGYETQEVVINASQSDLQIRLAERAVLGQEVVISASRVEESVLKSPVSIEKMDLRAIQQTAAPDFYSGLGNLKGIDLTTQSLTFKSVNMRGFGATGNVRITQLLDGMDNQAPGLNFPVDNIVGMPELDVESVEIIPGAASALYGPNALNGIILMNSKSPFRYQGLSAAVKVGVMNASNRDVATTPFSDVSVRYAKAFNNKWAIKFNAAYLQAKDWQATDYTDLNNPINSMASSIPGNDPDRGPGTRPNYDGMNVYGDENLQVLPGEIGSVTRTGYRERDLVDYNTKSLKFNGALHYRLSEKVELIGQVNYGTGTTVYTGNGRYSLRNFSLTQGKIELRGDNFMLRAYTTQERSGQSYTAGLQAIRMNEAWKPSQTWFAQYAQAYTAARQQGAAAAQAHLAARAAADQGRPQPGTEAFNALRDRYAENYISDPTDPGSAFLDKSNLYHVEGTYNLKNQIRFAEVLIGANYRVYQLRSNQTLFDDGGGTINIPEYGGFVQAAKALGPVKITASGRYDKNRNFEGRFTPRVAAVYTFAGENNLRLSYQTGFRIPTTQNQYIDLITPNARLIGALPQLQQKYGFATNPGYTLTDFRAAGAAVQGLALSTTFQNQVLTPQVRAAIQAQVTAAVTTPANLAQIQAAVLPTVTQQVTTAVQAQVAAGQLPASQAPAAIQAGVTAALPGAIQTVVTQTVTQQAMTAASNLVQLRAIQSVLAQGQLQPYQFGTFRTEKVATWEIGYKGLIGKKLFVDAYYYRSRYTDLVGGQVLLQSKIVTDSVPLRFAAIAGGAATRNAYSLAANSTQDVIGKGWALGLDYALPKGYTLGGNWSVNELVNFEADDAVQFAQYNTPRNRYNLSVGRRITPSTSWGFNVNFRHQDAFRWEAGFVQPSETSILPFQNTIVPANNIVDAQVSLKLRSLKSIVKVGGTNILNTLYTQAFGNPAIGGMYYVSLNFDELLN